MAKHAYVRSRVGEKYIAKCILPLWEGVHVMLGVGQFFLYGGTIKLEQYVRGLSHHTLLHVIVRVQHLSSSKIMLPIVKPEKSSISLENSWQ